jgi:protein-L-isoaspartate(D-aspartate) O-methyltransferase
MDRERELKIIRRASKQVTAAAGVGDPQVEAAFAAVAREDFLGPGPGTSVSSLSHDTALTGQSEFHYRRRRR